MQLVYGRGGKKPGWATRASCIHGEASELALALDGRLHLGVDESFQVQDRKRRRVCGET